MSKNNGSLLLDMLGKEREGSIECGEASNAYKCYPIGWCDGNGNQRREPNKHVVIGFTSSIHSQEKIKVRRVHRMHTTQWSNMYMRGIVCKVGAVGPSVSYNAMHRTHVNFHSTTSSHSTTSFTFLTSSRPSSSTFSLDAS